MGSRLFASGIGAPEGPVCLPDGSMYVTEMSGATLRITKLDPQGQGQVIKKTGGRPNGLTTDGHGRIWIAEAGLRALALHLVERRAAGERGPDQRANARARDAVDRNVIFQEHAQYANVSDPAREAAAQRQTDPRTVLAARAIRKMA